MRIPVLPAAIVTFLAVSAAPCQSSVVPAACATLPGNAGLSLPLRWSQGIMQVRIEASLLPPNFVGQTITGLHMRRPTFLGEPAYPTVTRTITVSGGFQPLTAASLTGILATNRPANMLTLFGPAPVVIPATPATGPTSVVGDELFHIQFTTPLPVTAGSLFLEFETSDPPFQVLATHWVDAVWFDDGQPVGYQATVGNGSCSTLAAPTQLVWNDPTTGPIVSGTAKMRLSGAPAGDLVFAWIGLDPQTAGGGFPGFGFGLGVVDPTMAACHLWAPLDATWTGSADSNGNYTATFPLTGGAVIGMRLGVQMGWLDLTRPTLPFTTSNGLLMVLNTIGVGTACATAFFPPGATQSPWYPDIGQMPVLTLDH